MNKQSAIRLLSSKNSARRRMIEKEKIPQISPRQTVGEVLGFLEEKISQFETINYLYATDADGKIAGVVSIKEIFAHSHLPQTKISEIMKKDLIVVPPDAHQEKAAILAVQNNLKAIPVVEEDKTFLGVISSDIILNILHEENTEDVLRSVGVSPFKNETGSLAKEIIAASSFTYFKKRLPWLLVGLGGGILAVFVVGFFEKALEGHLIIAFFIPLVVYLADAVGAQTQTLYIRSIAIEHDLQIKKYFKREIGVGLFLAISLGLAMAIFSMLFWKTFLISAILGISIFITVLVSMTVALFLPWFFLKIKKDPAIASGPFATIIRDILSLLIYLSIARLLFGFWG